MGKKAKPKQQTRPVNEDAANSELKSSGYAEIKKECEKAVAQIEKKNFRKAHGMLKKSFSTRGGEERVSRLSAALIHRMQASIWWEEALNMDSRKEKLRCWRNTVEEAKRATELSPDSIEFAHYYALSVFDMVNGEGEGEVEEVVRECNRGLEIENPIDPVLENWFPPCGGENTGEKRIESFRRLLRRLVEKVRLGRMSSESEETEEETKMPQDGLMQESKKQMNEKGVERIDKKMEELMKPEVEKGNERRLERRKFGIGARKFEEMNRFREFWDSMSAEKKREGFLRIRVSDLKGYFETTDKNVVDVLNEALGFVEEKRGWRFWTCCKCEEKFEDEKGFEKHCDKHFWKLIPRLEEAVPSFLRKDYLAEIVSCSWKPIDVSSAVELLGGHCKDSDISAEEEPIVCSNHGWPECEDSERGPILDEIKYLLLSLIGYECLADYHINVIEQFTLTGLESLASGSHLLKHGLDKTPVGICFLEAPCLQDIVCFLRTIFDFCESVRNPGTSGVLDDGSIANQWDEVEEKIVLSNDASWLCLDDNLLPLDSAADATPAADANADKLLSWIFSGPLSKDQMRSWIRKKEEKVQQGVEIFQTFQRVFKSLENLCEQKKENIDAFIAMADLCFREGTKKENGIKVSISLFEKQVDEILQNTELKVIHSVIRYAQALIVNQLSDLESGEDDSGSEDYWLQVDTCIGEGLKSLKGLSVTEVSKLDVQIMLNKVEWQKLTSKLNLVSANDYRLILSSLVKSYLRARLEALAKEKSDVASQALLAELELDSKRQEKAKVKKKTKREKRDKKLKASISKEHHLPDNMAYEEYSPRSVTADSDHPDSDNLQSANEDPLKLQEEKLKLKTEAEETKLEEALEDQRRIENETKVMKNEFLNQAEEMDVEPGKESQGLPHGEKTQGHSLDERGYSVGENQLPEKESMQVGVGLRNNFGENNCFLNVIIQSLWHLRRFRDKFLMRTEHVHVGAPCVVCALRDVFIELRTASTNSHREVVAPTALRKALSELQTTKDFKEGEKSDAADAYLEILKCLHDSASTLGSESVGNKDKSIWDCTKDECIAHSVFGLNKPQCHQCNQKSRSRNTSFNYQITASFIETKKVMHADSIFDKLLDLDKNSCNHIDHSISNPPPVFTIVLEWESGREMSKYIAATLVALSTEIDLSLIYHGVGSQHKHTLISVVNYHSREHYCCFIYARELERWVRYNDENVEVIGSWTDVLTMCKMECIQPQILFFEDAHIEDATEKTDAAREALPVPAEEPDSKRGVQRGKNNLKSSHEKAKVKKKTRKEKRVKKHKVIIPKKHHLLGNRARKQASPGVSTDGDHLDSDILQVQAVNEDPLKLQKEEFRRKIELEAEKTKLKEALECQRMNENEAKLKQLAAQQLQESKTPLSKTVSGQVQDVNPDLSEREPSVNKSWFLRQPEGMHTESGQEIQDWRSEQRSYLQVGNVVILTNESSADNADAGEVYRRTGVKNDINECGCFLKVIIQSLWHLSLLREKFLRRYTSEHVHEGDPCVVCALHDLFVELSIASTTMQRKAKAIATTSLRVAISALARQRAISELNQQKGISESYRQKVISEMDEMNNFFPEGQMSNAFEVLNVIFDCIRRASTPGFSLSQEVQRLDPSPWDSSLFRMDVDAKMDCYECKRVTEDRKYTFYLHYTHAKTLLRMKAEHTESAFDDLLCRVLIRRFPCRVCMKRNHLYYIMSTPPRVFTTVVDWEDACDSGDDITTLLTILSTEIDLSVLYRGLAPNHKHNLVSMVCYRSGHYRCFIYSDEDDLWLMYDHLTEKEIGSWTDVLTLCIKEHLQPQVLSFLAAECFFQDKQ